MMPQHKWTLYSSACADDLFQTVDGRPLRAHHLNVLLTRPALKIGIQSVPALMASQRCFQGAVPDETLRCCTQGWLTAASLLPTNLVTKSGGLGVSSPDPARRVRLPRPGIRESTLGRCAVDS